MATPHSPSRKRSPRQPPSSDFRRRVVGVLEYSHSCAMSHLSPRTFRRRHSAALTSRRGGPRASASPPSSPSRRRPSSSSADPADAAESRCGESVRDDATPDTTHGVRGCAIDQRVVASGLEPNTWQRFERLSSAWNQAKLGIGDQPQGAAETEPDVVTNPRRRARTPLTDSQVDAIRNAPANGESVVSICHRFEVHRMTVWTHAKDWL